MALLTDRPQRACDYCGEVLRGRADKRFCNGECRNGFHNHHAAIEDAFMRKVNKVLRRNRRILAALTPDGKNYATRTRLDDRGFSFKYCTHTSPSREGQQYTWVYEYGYLEIKPNYFMLVHRVDDQRGRRTSTGSGKGEPDASRRA